VARNTVKCIVGLSIIASLLIAHRVTADPPKPESASGMAFLVGAKTLLLRINGDGVDISEICPERTQPVHLKLFEAARGQAIAQAMAQKQSDGDTMIAVGVAAEDPIRDSVTYFMLFGRGTANTLLQENAWSESGVLTKCAKAQSYQGISVSLPEGDTVAMSLQRFRRGTDSKYLPLETAVFVHTCPVRTDGARMLPKLIWQYAGVLKSSLVP
jgi:hypothetical protein